MVMPAPVKHVVLALWLGVSTLSALAVAGVALLMLGEALARSGNGAIAVVLGLIMVGAPACALAGIIAAVMGRARVAWLVTGLPAGVGAGLYGVVAFFAWLWR
jgi:hypothetical protein